MGLLTAFLRRKPGAVPEKALLCIKFRGGQIVGLTIPLPDATRIVQDVTGRPKFGWLYSEHMNCDLAEVVGIWIAPKAVEVFDP